MHHASCTLHPTPNTTTKAKSTISAEELDQFVQYNREQDKGSTVLVTGQAVSKFVPLPGTPAAKVVLQQQEEIDRRHAAAAAVAAGGGGASARRGGDKQRGQEGGGSSGWGGLMTSLGSALNRLVVPSHTTETQAGERARQKQKQHVRQAVPS
jgi:hypothetical protein